MVIELFLAIVDCFRGLISGHDLWKEIKTIPSRVGVTILLRELMTITAGIDAARGLPVIQMNFLGYDEQAHRRGPMSAYAHWSLKGIDDAIKRIWNAARQSHRRDYLIWIYSDHGQEQVTPYEQAAGRTIDQAVNDVFQQLRQAPADTVARNGHGKQSRRIRHLGNRLPNQLIPKKEREPLPPQAGKILIAAVGPIGHIYLPTESSADELGEACRLLANTADVPLALIPGEAGTARAWTREGEFLLPRDAAKVLGENHPFLETAATDLVQVCHHPDSGDVILCGWREGQSPLSFTFENGAHGGVGPEETRGFAILPSATPLPDMGRDFLRPADVRNAALDMLGRSGDARRLRPRNTRRDTLRIATYNVHSCVGLDGKLSTSRIARVLAQCDADIVALQELDVRRARSGHMDQARELARLLEMELNFHPALRVEEEHYGDAVLSRFPMRVMRAGPLPGAELHKGLEPRGAIWVAVQLDGHEIHLINTHLGLLADERWLQVGALLGPDWLDHPDCRGPVVLCGDFNALPGSRTYRRLAGHLRDSQRSLKGHRPKKTWFSHYPLSRIDHVFLGAGLDVVRIEVPRSQLARVASDHLPMVVDLKLTESKPRPNVAEVLRLPTAESSRTLAATWDVG